MFKIEPQTFTVKDVANALSLTPRAVRLSIQRTGYVRGVKIDRNQGTIRFSSSQFMQIVNSIR